MQATKQL
ncbi:hypothetical protein FBULB1_8791, partial [Fusarium bulbicola]